MTDVGFDREVSPSVENHVIPIHLILSGLQVKPIILKITRHPVLFLGVAYGDIEVAHDGIHHGLLLTVVATVAPWWVDTVGFEGALDSWGEEVLMGPSSSYEAHKGRGTMLS